MREKNEPIERAADAARVEREARDWVRRLNSGEVSQADIDAWERWRLESRAHRRAFAEANLLWDSLGPLAQYAKARGYSEGPARKTVATRLMSRRAVFGGAVAAATVGGAAYVSLRSPLGLWPTLSELRADYRTATGERRQLTVASGFTIEMNTRTSLVSRASEGTAHALELLSGEVAVSMQDDASKPLVIIAAEGQIRGDRAGFDVRKDTASVCVTCSKGAVEVRHRAAVITLRQGQQVAYDDQGLGVVAVVDVAVITSWQRGLLIFRSVPLAQVVDEVNRYRPGRIIILNPALGRRRIVAGFRLDRIDEVLGYICHTLDAQARMLPGGIVLLS